MNMQAMIKCPSTGPKVAYGLRDWFAVNVRHFRAKRRMSQADLAVAAQISRESVNRIEGGRYAVSIETVDQIATALGVSPADLLVERDADDAWDDYDRRLARRRIRHALY